MSELPSEAERLLAVSPGDFVAERQRLARELREAGRSEESAAVAGLRKPSAVVFAVNRSARDRSQAARAAVEAARRVEKAQAGGDAEAFRSALAELDESLDLLAEVAVAHVAPSGKKPTDAMRRRVHDLLRRAAADGETRDALVRGALIAEPEATGFSQFAGAPARAGRRARQKKGGDGRATRQQEQRKERKRALRDELELAEQALAETVREEREAERARKRAERSVEALRAKLERLR